MRNLHAEFHSFSLTTLNHQYSPVRENLYTYNLVTTSYDVIIVKQVYILVVVLVIVLFPV